MSQLLPSASVVFLFVLTLCSCSHSGRFTKGSGEVFVHPGLLHSKEELAFVRTKLASRSQPWEAAWKKLRQSPQASLSYRPQPRAHVVRGAYNRIDAGSSDLSRDGGAAYSHALQWALTGKEAHAKKTIEILNAWSFALESIGGHDAKLLVGLDGVLFCNAAELIRHSDAHWPEDEEARFEKMLRTVFYPIIKDFYPSANGNWDASMIQTMIAMGIFLDDRAMFNRAVRYYRKGKGNGAINHYLNEFGQCQESGRDQLHVQMGLGFLGVACEMAWKQGVDLYGVSDNRLAKGYEYTAKYNLGEEVPFVRFRSYQGRYDYSSISGKGRGRVRPIHERVLHHYKNRRGLAMPWTQKLAEKNRPEGHHKQHASWGTLTLYGTPVPGGTQSVRPQVSRREL